MTIAATCELAIGQTLVGFSLVTIIADLKTFGVLVEVLTQQSIAAESLSTAVRAGVEIRAIAVITCLIRIDDPIAADLTKTG